MYTELRELSLECDATFFRDVYDYVGDTIEFAFFVLEQEAQRVRLEEIIDLVENEAYDELPLVFQKSVDLLLRTGVIHNSNIVKHLNEIKLTQRLAVL